MSSGATTVTTAPARWQVIAFPAAATSPPTITQCRPSRRRKTGWVRIRRGIVPDGEGCGNRAETRLRRVLGNRDAQTLPRTEHAPLAEPVHVAEARDAHPVSMGDVGQRLAVLHPVGHDRVPNAGSAPSFRNRCRSRTPNPPRLRFDPRKAAAEAGRARPPQMQAV